MQPRHGIIYVRVSTADQADHGVSLDTQERACGDWAFRNQVQVLRTFREEGKSAKTLNRPEMQSMLAYLKEHAQDVDYVIVYQIDRLTRSSFDFTDLMRLLAKYGIELRDSASNIVASESDELIQSIHAALAQYDNKLKSRRVTDNMKRHTAEGYRMHQAPYGLKNIRNPLGRPTLQPVQPMARNIAHLLTEFAKGIHTKADLLREARRIGLTQPNGKPMIYQYLDKLLRQSIYAGLEKNSLTDGQIVHSVFPGIVPEWVYYANQALLESRKNQSIEGRRAVNPQYPLRRFLICAACGTPIRGSAPTGRSGKKYPRYHCTTPSCHSAFVPVQDLHDQWTAHLEALKPSADRLKLIEAIIVRVWHDEVKSLRTRRDALRQAVDALDEERIDAAERVAKGDLTREEKDAVVKRIDQRLVVIRRDLRTLESNIGTKQDAIEYAVNYIGQAARLWENASPEYRLIFQRMVYPDGLPYNLTTQRFGTARMSLLYTVATSKKDPSDSEESHMEVQLRSDWNQLLSEINHWYEILSRVYAALDYAKQELNQAA
jgi:DNA invertase Pin-like site-specific DNA recombinase